jgi:hypothetical protein
VTSSLSDLGVDDTQGHFWFWEGDEAKASDGDVTLGCGLSDEAEENFDRLTFECGDVDEFARCPGFRDEGGGDAVLVRAIDGAYKIIAARFARALHVKREEADV